MVTCEGLLEQVTAPGTYSSGSFVAERGTFRDELREFFNATALDDPVQALADRGSATAGRLMGLKHGWASAGEQLATLSTLRAELHAAAAAADAADAQAAHLTDVDLEKYTVTLLAAVAGDMEGALDWAAALGAIAAAATCLALSRVTSPVTEATAVAAELGALAELPVVAAAAAAAPPRRCCACGRRWSGRCGSSKPSVAALPPSMPTASARWRRRLACWAPPRQFLQRQRSARTRRSTWPASRRWWGGPPGPHWASPRGTPSATGVLVARDTIGEVVRPASEAPVVAVVARSSGEEDVPGWVLGVVLGHDLPHLSHLGVRVRHVGVVVVSFGAFVGGDGSVGGLAGTRMFLAVDAGAGRVELTPAPAGAAGPDGTEALPAADAAAAAVLEEIGGVGVPAKTVMAIVDGTPAMGGAKAVVECQLRGPGGHERRRPVRLARGGPRRLGRRGCDRRAAGVGQPAVRPCRVVAGDGGGDARRGGHGGAGAGHCARGRVVFSLFPQPARGGGRRQVRTRPPRRTSSWPSA
ncbi:hypothetical protein I4F81_009476 [Pyropia yezoensis]|uniref:Uncharacterized protein n=1 Tax=Pyropia yezoensis TaxID=2788 RepID=A0ACC3CAJ4_PYRYE|nr:hypothetical protein I4F81_009476 [Neopyropia yezoensis]